MKPKILVVGDIMLDRYIHGSVERISPEAPIPILRRAHIEHRAGGAANVAANLASLGAATMLVGAIGSDKDGDILHELCKDIGRRWLALNAPLGLTTVKERYVCAGQQMLRVDQDGGRPTERALADINQAVAGHMSDANALILSDYAGGVLADPQYMIGQARSLGVPVYVDPKGNDWERYRGASLIKPNRAELREQLGGEMPDDVLSQSFIIKELLDNLDIGSMLFTDGANGMTMIHREGAAWHQPAKSGQVVDVTGAGDTVLAVVAYLRCHDPHNPALSWIDVLALAAKGAAAVCARHGTSVVTGMDLGLGAAKFRHFIESAPLVNPEFIA